MTICSFPKSILDRLIAENPDLEHRLLQQALNELDEAREWMVTLGRKTAREKIASFLYLIASQFDAGSSTFQLPLSRSDIADFLGLTTETVSRQFTRLRQSGVIEVEQRRRITILDIDRLLDETGT